MASSFCEDLTCSICLTIFTDPVTLPCGHSFCRRCVTLMLDRKRRCPHCQAAVPVEKERLTTIFLLRSLAEKAKVAKIRKEQGREAADLCPEHEEKLKLFCVTDQQLACIICRDGESHTGHKFKPIKEAAVALRKELEDSIENLGGNIHTAQSLVNTQRDEITKNKQRSQQLMTQIHIQFEKMHQFLRKREDELKTELKHKEEDSDKKMNEAFKAMQSALSESRELEVKAASVLEINDPEQLLKSWTEVNGVTTPEHLLRPTADLRLVKSSLSLGPYESHLQFFIWKEMLQTIQPRPDRLSLKSNTRLLTISGNGRSLFCTAESNQTRPGSSLFGTSSGSQRGGYGTTGESSSFVYTQVPGGGLPFDNASFEKYPKQHDDVHVSSSSSTNYAFSVIEFSSEQHYWEVDVGHRVFWELGIKDYFLRYDGDKYSTCGPNTITELSLTDKPRKIGIYLHCSSMKLSFYDADRMTLIHTLNTGLLAEPVSAYFSLNNSTQGINYSAQDHNPVTVCWY